MKTKKFPVVIGCLLVIAASAVWIYYSQFKAPRFNVALHERIGEVMAEQTAKAVSGKARVLLITIPTSDQPELASQVTAFKAALKKLGDYDLKIHELDTKDQPKYGPGSGLSGRRFVRAVKNHPCEAIVSFVGAPRLTDEQVAELKKIPAFIAETRSAQHLPKLFETGIIRVAVVSRFVFPAPGPLKPSTPQEWFDKRYQVITLADTNAIPVAE